jgi:hypothetical protein
MTKPNVNRSVLVCCIDTGKQSDQAYPVFDRVPADR